MYLAVAVFVVISVAALLRFFKRSPNSPPGPWGLPVVGALPWMEQVRKERTYLAWARQYGAIYSVPELGRPTVVLSDPDLIRDAFSRTATASRVPFSNLEDLFYTDRGIIFSNGEVWQNSRRFTLHHLRNLGMGRSSVEGVIQTQISQFMDEILAPSEGKPIDFSDSLRIAIANIIWGMVSSENFSIQDTRALSVVKDFEKLAEHMFVVVLMILFPLARRLPDTWTGLSPLRVIFDNMMNSLFRPAIAKHSKTIDMDDEPRDVIDALLQQQARDPESCPERHILRTILDLFIAGYDTTSTSLKWTFCLLAKHPDDQRRLRRELQQVLGGRTPSLADRPNLPITEATIMEVQRVADIAPIGVEHLVSETFQLGGYTVPCGAKIVSLLAAVHMDAKHFEDPKAFRPHRFLDAEGKVKPNKALMPFSVGKRACLGEALARSEMFLFVTRVLQKYQLRFPEGFQHDLSVEESRYVREPTPFQLIAEEVPVTE